jgi:hypothetical protein
MAAKPKKSRGSSSRKGQAKENETDAQEREREIGFWMA